MSRVRVRVYQTLTIAGSLGLFMLLWWLKPPNECTVTDVLTFSRCEGGTVLMLAYGLASQAVGWSVVGAMYMIETKRMRRRSLSSRN